MAEVTKELAEKIYKLVETVKVDGKLRKGANEATKSIERGEAKLVVAAKDVDPREITMHFDPLCKDKNIPFIFVPSKAELGAAAGLPVSTAAVAVANPGDAKKALNSVLNDLEALGEGAKPKEAPVETPKEPKEEKKEEEKPEKPEAPKEIKEEKPVEAQSEPSSAAKEQSSSEPKGEPSEALEPKEEKPTEEPEAPKKEEEAPEPKEKEEKK